LNDLQIFKVEKENQMHYVNTVFQSVLEKIFR